MRLHVAGTTVSSDAADRGEAGVGERACGCRRPARRRASSAKAAASATISASTRGGIGDVRQVEREGEAACSRRAGACACASSKRRMVNPGVPSRREAHELAGRGLGQAVLERERLHARRARTWRRTGRSRSPRPRCRRRRRSGRARARAPRPPPAPRAATRRSPRAAKSAIGVVEALDLVLGHRAARGSRAAAPRAARASCAAATSRSGATARRRCPRRATGVVCALERVEQRLELLAHDRIVGEDHGDGVDAAGDLGAAGARRRLELAPAARRRRASVERPRIVPRRSGRLGRVAAASPSVGSRRAGPAGVEERVAAAARRRPARRLARARAAPAPTL